MMSEDNSFGSMLTTARRRMGWKQQELAEKFDTPVSRVTVSRWEKDIQHPSSYHLEKLIAILGLNDKEADALNRASGQPTFRIRILPLRNQLFTGREGQLELVGQLLKENSSVALIGLTGMGKTQIALEYAHCSYPVVYRAVFWVDAANSTTLLASYDKIARKLGLPEQEEPDQDLRKQAVKGWLEDHTNWLLIMDNADNLSLARSFFPSAHDGHILLTTRTQIVGKVARKIEVEKMEPEEGQLFLLRRSYTSKVKATLNDFATDTREAALRVVELLDGHPLALDQAGAYIEGGVSLIDYMDHYKEQRWCLLEDRGPLDDDHPESVVVTFELCFEKARAQHPLATDILRFCSFLHPDAIPDELFKCDDSFKLDKIALKKGKEALLRFSLMKPNAQEKTFSMHRLVQAVLIDAMSPHLQKQWRERVVHALYTSFQEVELEDWQQCERLLPHAFVCATWTEDEFTPTIEAALLFHKAGLYLYSQWQDYGGGPLLPRVLPIYERHFGVDHPVTASILYDLAFYYHMQGKYAQAYPLFQRAYTLLVGPAGADYPANISRVLNLAVFFDLSEKFEVAELLYRQSLTMFEKHLGADHPDIAFPLSRLAGLLRKQGKHEQAEALLQSAHCIHAPVTWVTHPLPATVIGFYAGDITAMLNDVRYLDLNPTVE